MGHGLSLHSSSMVARQARCSGVYAPLFQMSCLGKHLMMKVTPHNRHLKMVNLALIMTVAILTALAALLVYRS